MKLNLHISQKEIDKQAKMIFSPARYGESGVGMCYLGCKIDYNILAFLSRPKVLRQNLGSEFGKVFFVYHNLSDSSDWLEIINKIHGRLGKAGMKVGKKTDINQLIDELESRGKRLHLLLTDGHQVPSDSLKEIVVRLHQGLIDRSGFGVVIFFESDVYRREIQEVLQESHKFLQNVMLFPAYSLTESFLFVKTLAEEWKMKISETEIKKIVNRCGGFLWVLREGLRLRRDRGEIDWQNLISESGMQFRLDHIYSLLSDREKESLAECCFGDADKASKEDRDYFIKMGLVRVVGRRHKLGLGLLESRVRQELITQSFMVLCKDIYYRGDKITSWFSVSEFEVMKLLIDKKGEIVEKEEIAEAMWGKSWPDKYSDWAIDKLMSRLRKVMVSYGLPKKMITTKKGQGFIIK
jgi:hypothetical protein